MPGRRDADIPLHGRGAGLGGAPLLDQCLSDLPGQGSLHHGERAPDHPFGTIKAWMGATHFRMRRLGHVRTEMAFHVLAYNIKRMISLIGVRGLLAAIPA